MELEKLFDKYYNVLGYVFPGDDISHVDEKIQGIGIDLTQDDVLIFLGDQMMSHLHYYDDMTSRDR